MLCTAVAVPYDPDQPLPDPSDLFALPDGFGMLDLCPGRDLLPGCSGALRQPLCSVQQPVRHCACRDRRLWSMQRVRPVERRFLCSPVG